VARVLHRSVVERGWAADAAVPAILALAADPETRGPGRLPCPEPWWEAAERGRPPAGKASSTVSEDWGRCRRRPRKSLRAASVDSLSMGRRSRSRPTASRSWWISGGMRSS
jgi:hypothetical protein